MTINALIWKYITILTHSPLFLCPCISLIRTFPRVRPPPAPHLPFLPPSFPTSVVDAETAALLAVGLHPSALAPYERQAFYPNHPPAPYYPLRAALLTRYFASPTHAMRESDCLADPALQTLAHHDFALLSRTWNVLDAAGAINLGVPDVAPPSSLPSPLHPHIEALAAHPPRDDPRAPDVVRWTTWEYLKTADINSSTPKTIRKAVLAQLGVDPDAKHKDLKKYISETIDVFLEAKGTRKPAKPKSHIRREEHAAMVKKLRDLAREQERRAALLGRRHVVIVGSDPAALVAASHLVARGVRVTRVVRGGGDDPHPMDLDRRDPLARDGRRTSGALAVASTSMDTNPNPTSTSGSTTIHRRTAVRCDPLALLARTLVGYSSRDSPKPDTPPKRDQRVDLSRGDGDGDGDGDAYHVPLVLMPGAQAVDPARVTEALATVKAAFANATSRLRVHGKASAGHDSLIAAIRHDLMREEDRRGDETGGSLNSTQSRKWSMDPLVAWALAWTEGQDLHAAIDQVPLAHFNDASDLGATRFGPTPWFRDTSASKNENEKENQVSPFVPRHPRRSSENETVATARSVIDVTDTLRKVWARVSSAPGARAETIHGNVTLVRVDLDGAIGRGGGGGGGGGGGEGANPNPDSKPTTNTVTVEVTSLVTDTESSTITITADVGLITSPLPHLRRLVVSPPRPQYQQDAAKRLRSASSLVVYVTCDKAFWRDVTGGRTQFGLLPPAEANPASTSETHRLRDVNARGEAYLCTEVQTITSTSAASPSLSTLAIHYSGTASASFGAASVAGMTGSGTGTGNAKLQASVRSALGRIFGTNVVDQHVIRLDVVVATEKAATATTTAAAAAAAATTTTTTTTDTLTTSVGDLDDLAVLLGPTGAPEDLDRLGEPAFHAALLWGGMHTARAHPNCPGGSALTGLREAMRLVWAARFGDLEGLGGSDHGGGERVLVPLVKHEEFKVEVEEDEEAVRMDVMKAEKEDSAVGTLSPAVEAAWWRDAASRAPVRLTTLSHVPSSNHRTNVPTGDEGPNEYGRPLHESIAENTDGDGGPAERKRKRSSDADDLDDLDDGRGRGRGRGRGHAIDDEDDDHNDRDHDHDGGDDGDDDDQRRRHHAKRHREEVDYTQHGVDDGVDGIEETKRVVRDIELAGTGDAGPLSERMVSCRGERQRRAVVRALSQSRFIAKLGQLSDIVGALGEWLAACVEGGSAGVERETLLIDGLLETLAKAAPGRAALEQFGIWRVAQRCARLPLFSQETRLEARRLLEAYATPEELRAMLGETNGTERGRGGSRSTVHATPTTAAPMPTEEELQAAVDAELAEDPEYQQALAEAAEWERKAAEALGAGFESGRDQGGAESGHVNALASAGPDLATPLPVMLSMEDKLEAERLAREAARTVKEKARTKAKAKELAHRKKGRASREGLKASTRGGHAGKGVRAAERNEEGKYVGEKGAISVLRRYAREKVDTGVTSGKFRSLREAEREAVAKKVAEKIVENERGKFEGQAMRARDIVTDARKKYVAKYLDQKVGL